MINIIAKICQICPKQKRKIAKKTSGQIASSNENDLEKWSQNQKRKMFNLTQPLYCNNQGFSFLPLPNCICTICASLFISSMCNNTSLLFIFISRFNFTQLFTFLPYDPPFLLLQFKNLGRAKTSQMNGRRVYTQGPLIWLSFFWNRCVNIRAIFSIRHIFRNKLTWKSITCSSLSSPKAIPPDMRTVAVSGTR